MKIYKGVVSRKDYPQSKLYYIDIALPAIFAKILTTHNDKGVYGKGAERICLLCETEVRLLVEDRVRDNNFLAFYSGIIRARHHVSTTKNSSEINLEQFPNAAKSISDSPSNTTLNEHSFLFPLVSLAVYTTIVVLLKMCGGLILAGTTVTWGGRSPLSRATGSVQLTNAVEPLMLTRISEGQLMNTGGITSVRMCQYKKYVNIDEIGIHTPSSLADYDNPAVLNI